MSLSPEDKPESNDLEVSTRRWRHFYTDGYHSDEQAELLLGQIAAAREAQKELSTPGDTSHDTEHKIQAAYQCIQLGKRALHEIITVNAPFALTLARASMGYQSDIAKKGSERLSVRHMRRFASPYAELDDRVQTAMYGLLRAALFYNVANRPENERTQTNRNFLSFAARCIQMEMVQNRRSPHIRETLGPRVSDKLLVTIRAIHKKYGTKKLDDFAHECAIKDVSVCEGCEDAHQVYRMRQSLEAYNHLLLDDYTFPEAAAEEAADEWTKPPVLHAADIWADQNPVDMLANIANTELVDAVNNALARLSDRDQQIFRMRYGLQGSIYTASEIAEHLSMTANNVRDRLRIGRGLLAENEVLQNFWQDNHVTTEPTYSEVLTTRLAHYAGNARFR